MGAWPVVLTTLCGPALYEVAPCSLLTGVPNLPAVSVSLRSHLHSLSTTLTASWTTRNRLNQHGQYRYSQHFRYVVVLGACALMYGACLWGIVACLLGILIPGYGIVSMVPARHFGSMLRTCQALEFHVACLPSTAETWRVPARHYGLLRAC